MSNGQTSINAEHSTASLNLFGTTSRHLFFFTVARKRACQVSITRDSLLGYKVTVPPTSPLKIILPYLDFKLCELDVIDRCKEFWVVRVVFPGVVYQLPVHLMGDHMCSTISSFVTLWNP
jgi:hypothetical protein